MKGIIVADIVQQMSVYQSLLTISHEQNVPVVLVTVFEIAGLPDYVDMMAFDLGSVASMQKVANPAGADVSTYIYIIALLAFIAVVEGIILLLRLKRRD